MTPTGADDHRRRLARRQVVVGMTALASTPLLAPWQAAAATEANSATPVNLAALLKRVQASSTQRNFAGVYVVSAGGSLSSARLVHYCNGRDQVDKIEGLDGQMRRVYRHNDLVHVLWPQSQEASIEPRELVGRLPGPAAAVARRPGFAASAASAPNTDGAGTAEVYEALLAREDRVAGYEAQVIALTPRDGYRYAQRWWVERETGLLLRTDLLGAKGEVLESAGFSELQIGVKPHPRQLLQEMHNLQGYRVQQPQFTRTTLEQEGWTLRRPLPGFRLHACVRRTPPRAHGGTPDTPGPVTSTMVQAIYTDGLMHVSLFIEPYDASRHGVDQPAVFGATRVNGKREGDWWITTVGEVPAVTLQAFLQGLERLKS